MARVNLERRAEIGLAKRTRTRAAILEAARTCYAAPKPAPVTVEVVMQAAGLAKGTFYLHFSDLAALEMELGGALIRQLDSQLQPARHAADHPLTRLATIVMMLLIDSRGCTGQGAARGAHHRCGTRSRPCHARAPAAGPRRCLRHGPPGDRIDRTRRQPRLEPHRAGSASRSAMTGSTRRRCRDSCEPSCGPWVAAPREAAVRADQARRHADACALHGRTGRCTFLSRDL